MSAITEAFAPLGGRAGRGPWFSADEILKVIDEMTSDCYVDTDAGYDERARSFNSGITELSDRLENHFQGTEKGQ